MTPYSALFGALKVADEVEIVVNASLRADAGQGEQPAWSDSLNGAWQPGPIIDPRVSSALWALLFFFILWLGMAAVGVAQGTAFVLARRGGVLHLPVRPHAGHRSAGHRSGDQSR